MPLHDDVLREDIPRARPRAENNFLGAEAHGRPFCRLFGSRLNAVRLILPLRDHRNDRMWCCAIELRAVRVRESQHVAAVLDDRDLHAEADSEVRYTLLTRVAHGLNLPLDSAFTEATGHQN